MENFKFKLTEFHCIDNNWINQLSVFKALYDTEDLCVKYLDEENEEVSIANQQDYEFALQYAVATNGYINLIIKNLEHIFAKVKFNVKKDDLVRNIVSSKNSDDSSILKDDDKKLKMEDSEWLLNYLNKFKTDIIKEMEHKIKDIVLSQSVIIEKGENNDKDDLEPYELMENNSITFEDKINKLLKMLAEARFCDRPLKKAYIEEELQLSSAFQASFVEDSNVPDGTQFLPKVRFQKNWLIQNTGKLEWNEKFPVKLVCIGGNISNIEEDSVLVNFTQLNEKLNVGVNLIAPSTPGEWYTEWTLVCRGFQFGPRLWCSIIVIESENDKLANFEKNFSDEDEFVVVPDCFDLNKKWKPEMNKTNILNDQNKKSIINDLENSYFEVSEQIENKTDESNKATSEIPNLENLEDDIEKSIPLNENIHKANETLATEDKISPNIQNEDSLNIQNTFDLIKNSFSDLKGPINIGDLKYDYLSKSSEKREISNNSKNSFNFNNSITNLTNAFGSLGSVYQGSNSTVSINEENLKTLINMGFANRNLNRRLLEEHNNDMDKVLQSLLDHHDNDPIENR